jgi:hypothetical protein
MPQINRGGHFLESELRAALAKNQELEDDYGKVKAENDKLRLEVERFMMELGALAEKEDAATKAFDTEKEEILMELEDSKIMKVEVTQDNKSLMKCENDKLQLDAFDS